MNTLIRTQLNAGLDRVLAPVAAGLASKEITPVRIVVFATLLASACAWLLVYGHLRAAGFVLLVAGLLRLLGGASASAHDVESTFSRFFIACLDNIVEGGVIVAIAVYASAGVDVAPPMLLLLAALTSNYVSARADSHGIQCNVGVATQPERVLVLSLALMTGWLGPAIELLIALTFITIGQQIWFVRGSLDSEW